VTSNKTRFIPHVLTKNTSLCSCSAVDNILNLSRNNITSYSILERFKQVSSFLWWEVLLQG